MTRLILGALAVFLILPIAHAEPSKVEAVFSKAYLPVGFDSNDNVQIVAEGMFKNVCYRPAETSVKIDTEKKTVTLGPVAYEYKGFCLQMVLPFDRTIELGIMAVGEWTVQRTDGTKLGVLKIRPATTESPDDYLYAPISQTFVRQEGSVAKILLSGEFSNSCMSLQEVKVGIQSDVIVVQPIAEFAKRADCKAGHFPFEKVTSVELIPPGRYLLHVRSMNAKAVSTLVDIR